MLLILEWLFSALQTQVLVITSVKSEDEGIWKCFQSGRSVNVQAMTSLRVIDLQDGSCAEEASQSSKGLFTNFCDVLI